MSKFKKKGSKEAPPISTASLPDIVFMLLFFFMIATVIRDTSILVDQEMPKATEIQKLQRRSFVSNIYIGRPIKEMRSKYGDEPQIQLNDSYKSLKDISDYIANEREPLTEAQIPLMTVSLKVDKKVKMGIVTEVKQELRKANSLKINYAATEE